MNREVAYLQIPESYFEGSFKTPRWSASGEAIERSDGSTLAFGVELGVFLEGFSSVGPLIHFAHVVHIFALISRQNLEDEGDVDGPPSDADTREYPLFDAKAVPAAERALPLVHLLQATGRKLRNLGALCAVLTREVPALPDPPSALELCLRLSNGVLLSDLAVQRWATSVLGDELEAPALDARQFAATFLGAFERLGVDDATAWLKHGRGRLLDVGERVAETIDTLRPRTLEGALDALAGRDRLAGAVPMVAQLVSALTLPPRRLAHRALPSGGYADVATRGRPEQILPSQFAIENIEFLRRFAENELLYFHREEPHAPVSEELAILIDQGVRTWGKVRAALAAAALAFGRLASRKGLPLRVGGTSSEGRLLDPLETDVEVLGALWEASDLSANPALALERILETADPKATRDVIVLSHPRSVADPDFAASTRRAPEGTRVFSVAIDEPGTVQFREWRHGVPVKIGDFRVDFVPPPRRAPAAELKTWTDPLGWKGDLEPVGFPFRFGVIHRIERTLFDFDHAGRWLLLCTYRGTLHLWKLDGSRAEVLPRGLVGGEVLEQVDAVLGVAGGFVVAGRVGKTLVAMHYDLGTSTARAHELGPTLETEWHWFYHRELHTLVARGRNYSRSLDLATLEIHYSRGSNVRPSSRAIRAFERTSNHFLPPPRLSIVDEATPPPIKGRSVTLNRATGEIALKGVTPPWDKRFQPLADGQPLLKNCWVDQAQLRADVLALVVAGPSRQTKLRLFHGPSGVPTRELPLSSMDAGSFMLSHEGRMIARRLGERQIEVRETAGDGPPIFITTKGKTHGDLKVFLGSYEMIIQVGKRASWIRWRNAVLEISTTAPESDDPSARLLTKLPASPLVRLPAVLDYDPSRFVACARAELTAVLDCFGQVILFDSTDRMLAMFLAFRGQVAAWMPDGTRMGPSQGLTTMVAGPVARPAAQRIGRVLHDATVAARRNAEIKP
jgi:hypothetical protein